jgi:hypothetical protein
VREGKLGAEEAALAAHVPVAEDITAEADSGGHTDNRPLAALLPVLLALRDRLQRQHRYPRSIRVGAAGGLGTPAAVAAAFSLGAAYVVTGSVNQAALESGLAEDGKRMLAEAGLADVMMAPCADMFELGVRVQVLRRGTMYGVRAQRLYDLYRSFDSLEALPAEARQRLESEILGATCDEVWSEVRRFFETRDPRELERALREPKHRMALVFRWYLGMASKWPVVGESRRRLDYQIWCGPAMGAFNDWVRGSFLEAQANRGVVQIALNLLEGAAVLARAQQLRAAGVAMPAAAFTSRPDCWAEPSRSMAATRIVHNADAIAWLQAQGKLVGASIITSLPDVSELPHLGLDGWRRWFEDAAALVMACTADEGVAIFFQSDIKHGGFWIDKGALVSRAAERAGMSCLFHKIVCRKPPGSSSFGRATYAHMLGFARGQPRRQKQARVDVLARRRFSAGDEVNGCPRLPGRLPIRQGRDHHAHCGRSLLRLGHGPGRGQCPGPGCRGRGHRASHVPPGAQAAD